MTDLSFVGTEDGWALGKVACPTGRCAALARTTDGGRTWQPLPPPPADVVDADQEVPRCSAPCLEHVRFATDRIGYLFGDGMWAAGDIPVMYLTTDGGRTWTRQAGGALALETLDNNVIRLVSDHSGCPGPCNVRVQTSGIGSSAWRTERLTNDALAAPFGAQLVRAGSDAYILATGHVAGGGVARSTLYVSHDDGLHWTQRGEPCPQEVPGRAGLRGEVDSYAIAAAPGGVVSVLCQLRTVRVGPYLAVSRDGGAYFVPAGGIIPAHVGYAGSGMLAGDPDTVLVAGGIGAYRSTDAGRTWSHIADLGNAEISFLGFENSHDGRAVTNGGRTIYTTHDGGRTWRPYTFP